MQKILTWFESNITALAWRYMSTRASGMSRNIECILKLSICYFDSNKIEALPFIALFRGDSNILECGVLRGG